MQTPTNKINSLLTLDTAVKLAVYLILFIVGYINMKNKLDYNTALVENLQKNYEQDKKERELKVDLIQSEIHNLDVRTSVIEQALKDKKNELISNY